MTRRPPTLPDCRHRGAEFAPGRWSCYSPRLLLPLGTDADLCRGQCPYVDHADGDASPTSREDPVIGEAGPHGVAIGTYDTLQGRHRYGVEAVHLNLAVLRARCGRDLRILVCDDGSPPDSQQRYRRLCDEYQAEFTTNSRRWGHTSGDMIAYYKAICWARRLGLATVTKVSHRMVIDVPDWIRQDAQTLLASGHATYAQMLTNFPTDQVRTECVMMVTREWSRPDVLAKFLPRKLETWNEGHAFSVIHTLVDRDRPYPGFLPWPRISYLRGADEPPVYFRAMRGNPGEQFQRLAERYGVPFSSEFSVQDSIQSTDYAP
jgi:hypothetical protein